MATAMHAMCMAAQPRASLAMRLRAWKGAPGEFEGGCGAVRRGGVGRGAVGGWRGRIPGLTVFLIAATSKLFRPSSVVGIFLYRNAKCDAHDATYST